MTITPIQIRASDIKTFDPKPIGRGSFGVVFRAKYGNDFVAIKRLANSAGATKATIDGFKTEASTLVQLNHPRIVRILGIVIEDEQVSIVMEYMPDGCLLSYYHANANPKPSITTRLALSMDIAAGMAFLHSQDPPVLHRDLKTPNILVRRDASGDVRAKISDLGSAAVMRLSTITSMMGSVMMERDREKRTLVGTYLYMAPELSGARIRYRCETDVFAFGVVLSEIASWEGPYGIPMEEFNHTLFNDCRSRKEPFPIDLEDVPEPFHDLVSGCLSVDPKARLTFSEISEALERMNEATDEGAGEGSVEGEGVRDELSKEGVKELSEENAGTMFWAVSPTHIPTAIERTKEILKAQKPLSSPCIGLKDKLEGKNTLGLNAVTIPVEAKPTPLETSTSAQPETVTLEPKIERKNEVYEDVAVPSKADEVAAAKLNVPTKVEEGMITQNPFDMTIVEAIPPAYQTLVSDWLQNPRNEQKSMDVKKSESSFAQKKQNTKTKTPQSNDMQEPNYDMFLNTVAIVVQDYIPNEDDEIAVFVGDQVEVLSVYADGWGIGQNLSTNRIGLLPLILLNEMTAVKVFGLTEAAPEYQENDAGLRVSDITLVDSGTPTASVEPKSGFEDYKTEAQRGDCEAQNKLGSCYLTGDGVKKDLITALYWFRQAADGGCIPALTNVGIFYSTGELLKKDMPEAVSWFQKAADKGDSEGQLRLGLCYQSGEVFERDDQEAVKYFTLAAEQGNSEAERRLGACCYTGQGVEKDTKLAMHWWQLAADKNNALAQCDLGFMYYDGEKDVVERNHALAKQWLEKSANHGVAAAQDLLGSCYMWGLGVDIDYQSAMMWYRKAAMLGFVNAQYNLGFYYDKIEKDAITSEYWLQKAARQGHVSAKERINSLGEKSDTDSKAILELFNEAEKVGNADAQCRLGKCFSSGKVVEKKDDIAVKWYQAAADQGHDEAQFMLGISYEFGVGVKKDLYQALRWYVQSASSGHVLANFRIGKHYAHNPKISAQIALTERTVDLLKNQALTVQWYKKAAQKGYAEVQNALGISFKFGHWVEANMEEAVKCFREAAEGGSLDAYVNMGHCYRNGNGVEKDLDLAIFWYEKAVDKEHAEAQYILGTCYSQGTGVKVDLEIAVSLYFEAAQSGHAIAHNSLGLCFQHGLGTEVNLKKAVEMYQKAAENGFGNAQWNLGICYRYGIGVDENRKLSACWQVEAVNNGYCISNEHLKRLYDDLNDDDDVSTPTFGRGSSVL